MEKPITRRDVANAASSSAQDVLLGCGCVGIIAVVAVVALIIIGVANAPDLSLPTKPNSSSSAPKTVTIKVSGTAGLPYSGNYGSASTGQRSVEGKVSQKSKYSIQSTQPFDVVSGVFQKKEAQGNLKVDIEVDGKTVKSQETSASYGVVSITHSP